MTTAIKLNHLISAFVIAVCLFGVQKVSAADEKCYGVAKAGQNDCDPDALTCDKSVIDGDPNFWLNLPKGMCDKLVGGMTSLGGSLPGTSTINTMSPPTTPGMNPATAPGMAPATAPGMTPATAPGMMPATPAAGSTTTTTTTVISTPAALPAGTNPMPPAPSDASTMSTLPPSVPSEPASTSPLPPPIPGDGGIPNGTSTDVNTGAGGVKGY
ncbi:MAG TPA: DUF2282 domain-containing protein [Gammaproteobacteria bacterium]|nr:DUF2282 domain-containing protein [Gammaproteobacteria bacterium]